MEDDRGHIDDLMQRYGYEEKEAEAAYHLREVRNRFREIYQDEAAAEGAIEEAFGNAVFARTYTAMFLMSAVDPHIDALARLLVKRSLDRQYPEGWGLRRDEDEGTEEG